MSRNWVRLGEKPELIMFAIVADHHFAGEQDTQAHSMGTVSIPAEPVNPAPADEVAATTEAQPGNPGFVRKWNGSCA